MNKLYLLLTIILLPGCDEVFDDTFYIQNNLDSEITLIYGINGHQEGVDTLLLQTNEKKLVINAHSAGGTKQYRIPVINVFNKFEVYSGFDLSQYDYFNDDYWEYVPTSGNTADYIMVVDSTHFK